ncbi:MAG TPA: ABC transporter ATP-binding protein [Acidimicrobiales bacterium]|nr:ABC transporter ATP-binding protein [Acidimicrobiales bacterium]
MSELAVDFQDVSKRFRLYHEKYTSLKEKLIHIGRVPHEDLWALRDVSFEVKEGETVGILGRNGSGKSTALKCVCGVLQPTSGQVVVRGKLAGLLELGAGFQQDLSGRENIYLNGSMLGLSKREVDRLFDDIVDFAELGQFIDNQVKFYSSGMYVRLGFAVAVNVDPDVLVVDEVLAVGDERFQRKCMDRIKQFQREGRTILFVSHSPDQVRAICDRAVVLSDGLMIGQGSPGEAVRLFRERLMEAGDVLAMGSGDEPPAPEPAPPSGPAVLPASIQVTAAEIKGGGSDSSRPVRITDVTAFYPEVNERRYLLPRETLIVRVAYQASEPSAGVVVAIEIRLADGTVLFRTDTEIMGLVHDVQAGPGAVDFHFDDLPLFDGSYQINVGITGPGGILYDWREPACTFEVMNPGRATGVIAVPVKVAIVPTELVESA